MKNPGLSIIIFVTLSAQISLGKTVDPQQCIDLVRANLYLQSQTDQVTFEGKAKATGSPCSIKISTSVLDENGTQSEQLGLVLASEDTVLMDLISTDSNHRSRVYDCDLNDEKLEISIYTKNPQPGVYSLRTKLRAKVSEGKLGESSLDQVVQYGAFRGGLSRKIICQ